MVISFGKARLGARGAVAVPAVLVVTVLVGACGDDTRTAVDAGAGDGVCQDGPPLGECG